MFSFHKPKVYRSSTGCCICKAKSSSSRFTDSKKYEEDFLKCFKLATPRQGEICNACVLLVKRWKKLPVGSERNWKHVVDARAGPGMKSLSKFKTKNKKMSLGGGDKLKKKHFDREYSPVLSDHEDMDMHDLDCLSEEARSVGSSRNESPGVSDNEDHLEQHQTTRGRRRKAKPRKLEDMHYQVGSFIDLDYWRKETICCGTIFLGQNDEIMVETRSLKPCSARMAMHKAKAIIAATPINISEGPVKSVYSDSSSDSGYDDCSNQGIAMSPEATVEHANRLLEAANRVLVQENRTVVQENCVVTQPIDLMCHETLFPQEKEVRNLVIGDSLGLYQSQETIIRH
ncbi:SIN3-HDAC complex-associated factor isoform X2 [Anthonomus grandis grandis]|nr:SIN3-HDAC complex-associated factor isoform X2 [Anthonomus grandis grandis]